MLDLAKGKMAETEVPAQELLFSSAEIDVGLRHSGDVASQRLTRAFSNTSAVSGSDWQVGVRMIGSQDASP